MKIVLASHNTGKLEEFVHLFTGTNITMLPFLDYCDEGIEETGLTFVENAILKARYGCQKTGLPCIADDSGLVVPALNGAPGIYSARYAGTHGDMSANIEKLLNEMQHVPETKRQAYFQCVLVFMLNEDDPTPVIAEARWHGIITHDQSGHRGHGYDPVVFLPQKNCTVAQLSMEEKNKLSHRAQAMKILMEKLC
ncbi:MAG: RdgB/HAM1 family non-canonical purine NTP pyrophosphatase [Gammaproteobacteria bacterium]|nr:RdgB/HAM1 family non-canonical purine NTP pyrophosphatase [Gammaproteobacteria bacterium]